MVAGQKNNNWPRTFGHRKAETAIQETVSFCLEKQVEALTLFVFSTENWKRPESEVKFIMELLSEFLDRAYDLLEEKEVRLRWLGEQNRLPKSVEQKFLSAVEKTAKFSKLQLSFAVDYGARLEIVQTVKKIAQLVREDKLELEAIDEDFFSRQLYTHDLPPLDLIIRTAGECRLSNFLLWQAAYSELFFCKTLWPDFSRKNLEEAFQSYYQRFRTKGKVREKK